jgi:hypothetical protein
MDAIEDVHKVIQDLVAPELKSLQEQIKGIEEASKLRDDALSAKVDSKFDILQVQIKGVEDSSKLREDALSAKVDSKFDTLQVQIKGVEDGSKLRDEALLVKIDALSDKVDSKFELVLAEMKANQAFLIYSMNIEKRVEAIERKSDAPMHAT